MTSLKAFLVLGVSLGSVLATAQQQFGGTQMPPGSIQAQQQQQALMMQQQQMMMQQQQGMYQQPVMQPGAALPPVAQGPGEQVSYASNGAMACTPRGGVSPNEGVIRGGVQVINTGGGSH